MLRGSFTKRLLSNVPFVMLVSFAITIISLWVQGLLLKMIMDILPSPTDKTASAFIYDVALSLTFVIPLALTLAFMLLTKRESLRVLGGGLKKSARALAAGLLVGMALNGALAAAAGISGAVSYSFNSFSPFLIAIIPPIFIQCTAEEMGERGLVPAYLEENHSRAVVAFAVSILFPLGHIENFMVFGFNAVFFANVAMLGLVLYLFIKLFDNFWAAAGFHLAWNFTQMYLLGLSNSGATTPYSLFTGMASRTNFFYDEVYGIEGSLSTTVVVAAVAIVLVVLLRRRDGGGNVRVVRSRLESGKQ